MAFEDVKENFGTLKDRGEDVVSANLKYYKLLLFKTFIKTNTAVVKAVMIGVLLLLVLFFFSFGLAFFIGSALDSYGLGFFIVGGFYLIVTFIAYKFRNEIVEKPLIVNFSKILLSDED
ncbi:competence protein [Flavobacterium litorale]|uniref:Competence protein n=1 Tax=Flavobacterium litorale TaxID=2856519 RepID=A0ABX8V877_9FLAO|nr:competence protein [Flavobacterium litorale]QYJ69035.1 competence protein [Flavobacterium litorale]